MVENLPQLNFYLVDDNDNILYRFPVFDEDIAVLNDITAVSFKDVNKDGLEDVIVIGDFMRGFGTDAGKLFPVVNIYFQKGKEFILLPELNKGINNSKNNENIDMILEFTKDKDIKIN